MRKGSMESGAIMENPEIKEMEAEKERIKNEARDLFHQDHLLHLFPRHSPEFQAQNDWIRDGATIKEAAAMIQSQEAKGIKKIGGETPKIREGIMYHRADGTETWGVYQDDIADRVFAELAGSHDPALVESVRQEIIRNGINAEIAKQIDYSESGHSGNVVEGVMGKVRDAQYMKKLEALAEQYKD